MSNAPSSRRSRFARTACVLGLTGAALFAPARLDSKERTPVLIQTERQWREALARRGVDPELLANPIAFDPAMTEAAAELAGSGTMARQARTLQSKLFDPDLFPFDYESRGTYSAIEAFARRQGNCVSFTNLFIALARSLGIPARAALVPEGGSSRFEEDLVVVNNHVVAALPYSGRTLVFDFYRERRQDPQQLRLIDDLWVGALYANNLGVERLRAGRLDEATAYLEAATRLAPGFADALGNLGVARRLAGDVDAALEAYRAALEIAPRDAKILTNLSVLFRETGRPAEAAEALAAARQHGPTTQLLLVQGHIERARGNDKRALKLYRKAHRADPGLSEPLVAMARAQLDRGKTRSARRLAERALERAPQDAAAQQLLESLERRR